MNSFSVVKEFELKISKYTNSKYAIAVDSCTNAIFLCCKYLQVKQVTIPCKTYLSVPQSIIHAGGEVIFNKNELENNWKGIYQLKPYPIYDSSKRLTSNMYIPQTYMCLSFHYKKHLKIGKGGMILTDNLDACNWFKRARYEGRGEMPFKNDDIKILGWNMYMTPHQAATGLSLLEILPLYNEDIFEKDEYIDLTTYSIFKNNKCIV